MKLKESIKSEINQLIINCSQKNELQLDKVCERLQIDYYEADFDDPKTSGQLRKEKDTNRFAIYTNRRHPDVRKRFTIAHEIGHYLSYKHHSFSYEELNEKGGIEDFAISFRHENIKSQAEIEANQMAAEMLMPEDKVKIMAEKELTIEEMAEEFFVSESAMTIRLQSLYSDLMVV